MPYSIQEIRVAYILGGLILCLYSVPFIRRSIRPNYLFGIVRTRAVVANPAHWYAINAYAARLLFLLSSLVILIAVLLAAIPGLSSDNYFIGCVAFTFCGVVFIWRATLRYMKSLS
jgi:SdpI/YfhL protein family